MFTREKLGTFEIQAIFSDASTMSYPEIFSSKNQAECNFKYAMDYFNLLKKKFKLEVVNNGKK